MLNVFVPETGIAVRVELTHSKASGYRLTHRRVVGWVTVSVDDGAGNLIPTTIASTSRDVDNGTGSYSVVRLHNVAEYDKLVSQIEACNRADIRKVKNATSAEETMRKVCEVYL